MCACMCACMCECVCVCVFMCACIRASMCARVCVRASVHITDITVVSCPKQRDLFEDGLHAHNYTNVGRYSQVQISSCVQV